MSNPYQYPTVTPPGPTRTTNPTSQPSLTETVLHGHDIRKSRAPAQTLQDSPLAVFANDTGTQSFSLSQGALSKHLLLIGGIGSGKTNTIFFLLSGLLKYLNNPRTANSGQNLVLIFDSKGDFYREFYDPWNKDHIVLGNHPAYAARTQYWNIFEELRSPNGGFDKSSELAAREIAKALYIGRESGNQPFFSNAAADMVAKVLIDFIRHRPARELNNRTLVNFFRTANVNAYHDLIDRNPDFESARDYFGKRGANLSNQALGVLSYITSMVNDVFIGIFAEGQGQGGFSMRKLVREKRLGQSRKVVFIEYDLNTGESLGPIYGLLYDLALKEDLGGRDHTGSTYYICDEFRILPKLNHINDALNLGRSLGVKVIAGLQTINQLYDVYGEELGKTLAAGFMNSMCFQTWDLDTRSFISGRFGSTYTNLAFHSLETPISTQRDGHVVEDWDILDLRVGEAFVNLTGYKPFRFRFQKYKERTQHP